MPVLRDVPDPEYRAINALSQSSLKLFMKDPLNYKQQRDGLFAAREQTESMRFGQRLDTFLLTGQCPAFVIPAGVLSANGSRSGSRWLQWQREMVAEHGPDVMLLKQEEFDKEIMPLFVARENILNHPKAGALLSGDHHVVVTWIDPQTGLACKCQLDNVPPSLVLSDLKSTVDTDPESFAKSVITFGYHIQAWWYRTGWRIETGEDRPFAFVCVKNTPSYCVETYDLHESFYELAEIKIRTALDRFVRAQETGHFQTPTHGIITTLVPPAWALNNIAE